MITACADNRHVDRTGRLPAARDLDLRNVQEVRDRDLSDGHGTQGGCWGRKPTSRRRMRHGSSTRSWAPPWSRPGPRQVVQAIAPNDSHARPRPTRFAAPACPACPAAPDAGVDGQTRRADPGPEPADRASRAEGVPPGHDRLPAMSQRQRVTKTMSSRYTRAGRVERTILDGLCPTAGRHITMLVGRRGRGCGRGSRGLAGCGFPKYGVDVVVGLRFRWAVLGRRRFSCSLPWWANWSRR